MWPKNDSRMCAGRRALRSPPGVSLAANRVRPGSASALPGDCRGRLPDPRGSPRHRATTGVLAPALRSCETSGFQVRLGSPSYHIMLLSAQWLNPENRRPGARRLHARQGQPAVRGPARSNVEPPPDRKPGDRQRISGKRRRKFEVCPLSPLSPPDVRK